MPAEIPFKEPTEVIAGNTVAWTKDLSDYPAGTWTLKYYLRGPATIDIIAMASGTRHSVSVSAATTAANWPPGTYKWQSFVSSGSDRYFVDKGEIVVVLNPATSTLTFETRTKAKVILDALDQAILENAGRPEQSYTIQAAGRQHTYKTMADMIIARDKFAAIVKQEEDAKKIMRGENTGKNILVRFN